MPTDPACLLYCPFFSGENADGNVPDFSGYGNDLETTGFAGTDVEFEDGHLGQCIHFDGAVDQLTSINQIYSIRNQPHTIEAWINVDALDGAQATIHTIVRRNNQYFHLRGDGSLSFYLGVYKYTAIGLIVPHNWYQVVVAYDNPSDTVSFFINGINVSTQAGPSYESNGVVEIGAQNLGTIRLFGGRINRVGWWHRTMGEAEIYQRYIHAKRM